MNFHFRWICVGGTYYTIINNIGECSCGASHEAQAIIRTLQNILVEDIRQTCGVDEGPSQTAEGEQVIIVIVLDLTNAGEHIDTNYIKMVGTSGKESEMRTYVRKKSVNLGAPRPHNMQLRSC